MRSGTSGTAVMRYQLPPDPPESALPAIERFESVASQLGALIGEKQDLQETAQREKAAKIRDAADAVADGKPVPDFAKAERELVAKLAEIDAKHEVLNLACHRAGNAMAAAVGAARGEWIAALEARRVDAEARYDAAMQAALEALGEVRVTRGSVAWLESFDAELATIGKQSQYHGKGRVEIENREHGQYRGVHDAQKLLELAARVTAPPEPAPPGPIVGTQGETLVGVAS